MQWWLCGTGACHRARLGVRAGLGGTWLCIARPPNAGKPVPRGWAWSGVGGASPWGKWGGVLLQAPR